MTKEYIDSLDPQYVIERGEIVKRAYEDKFGEVLRSLVNGRITKGLSDHQLNPSDRMPITPDRILGRLEGYQTIIDDLELMIQEAEDLQRPLEEDSDSQIT